MYRFSPAIEKSTNIYYSLHTSWTPYPHDPNKVSVPQFKIKGNRAIFERRR